MQDPVTELNFNYRHTSVVINLIWQIKKVSVKHF